MWAMNERTIQSAVQATAKKEALKGMEPDEAILVERLYDQKHDGRSQ